MTPPTLPSLRLIRQQLSEAHMENMKKLDEAIANLNQPPPAPPAKTRGQEIGEEMVTIHSIEHIAIIDKGGNHYWCGGKDYRDRFCGGDTAEVRQRVLQHAIGERIDAELARCEQEKQAALAAQQEQIAAWLASNDRPWAAVDIRSGKWKTPTTE